MLLILLRSQLVSFLLTSSPAHSPPPHSDQPGHQIPPSFLTALPFFLLRKTVPSSKLAALRSRREPPRPAGGHSVALFAVKTVERKGGWPSLLIKLLYVELHVVRNFLFLLAHAAAQDGRQRFFASHVPDRNERVQSCMNITIPCSPYPAVPIFLALLPATIPPRVAEVVDECPITVYSIQSGSKKN